MDFKNALDKTERLLTAIRSDKKKENKQKKFFNIFKAVVGVFLVFLLVVFVIISFLFFRFKGIYDSAILGKASLEYSLSNARLGDFSEMVSAATRAEGYFNDILKELESGPGNFIFKSNAFSRGELADVEYLAKSAAIISRSLGQAGELAGRIDGLLAGRLGENFSEFSKEEKQSLLKAVYESGPELNGIKANLELALFNLERIKAQAIFLPAKDKIDEARGQLARGVESLENLVLVSQIAPELFGYPSASHFLVLFQNNSELRPTGGFLGTYGILETESGDIARFDTHDIYHLDMPMEAGKLLTVEPPAPIAKYLNKNWYMRDSNWSPDWPTAAEKVQWFYGEENKRLPEANQINDFSGEFSGVVAITPELVEDLLVLIGPIEAAGETFRSDNFSSLLEYKVEQDFLNQNVSSWERKEVIAGILEEIKIKLFDLPYDRYPEIGNLLLKNIAEKNILVYFNDEHLEDLALSLGAGGEMKETAGDYLMVVDANMAALKTDAVVERTIEYQIEERAEGLFAKLRLNYKNNGSYDWRTGDYHTYTRVYVPQGAKIIKTEGITRGELETGSEAGRDYFAGFLSVRAGKQGSLYFEYQLPENLKKSLNNGQYSLYIQKQPGKEVKDLTVDFKALREVKSYNLKDRLKVIAGNQLTGNIDSSVDNELVVNFEF